MESNKPNSLVKKGAIGILSLGVVASIGYYLTQEKTGAQVLPQKTTTVSTPENPATAKVSAYKNGTYSAAGTYLAPSGTETVSISITVANDIITSASFKGNATEHTSARFQSKFSSGFGEVVVGKNINDVALTVVNGSSLTPEGFMDALAKVKAEAKI